MACTRRTTTSEKTECNNELAGPSSTIIKRPTDNYVSLTNINPYMYFFIKIFFNFSLEHVLSAMATSLMQRL